MDTKICTSCKETKSITEFSPRQAMCKACRRERYRGRNYNRVVYTKEQQAAYRTAHPTKVCGRCGIEKPNTAFHADKSTQDGLYTLCKSCKAEYNQQLWADKVEQVKDTPTEKVCSICGDIKPADSFSPDRRTNDGLYSACKVCANENKTTYSEEFQVAFRQARPFKQCTRCGEHKPYSEFYRNQSNTNRDGYGSTCIPCRKIYIRDHWYPNGGKEYKRVHSSIRRARKRNLPATLTVEQWHDVLNTYDNRCLRCGRDDVSLTIDHIIPIVKGGHHSINNVQPLCLPCNSTKHTKIIDYRPDRGSLWV